MRIENWRTFVESDAGLIMARVCRFWHIDPIQFLAEDIGDPYIQFCVAEALMWRHIEWEREMHERLEAEREQERLAEKTRTSPPGSLPHVTPPSVDDVRQMIAEQA